MAAIKCLSPKVRDMLVEILEELAVDDTILETLREMASCKDAAIEYETAPAHQAKEEAATPRKKRTPSAYQQHTSECMKGGHRTMSECAAAWRAKKGK
jgi:urocanate hydratase